MSYPDDFTLLLHQIRTEELQKTTAETNTMLSVGCNGKYYFDWIDANLGRPEKHIGLEYYLPRPDKLDSNVVWIANTAADMSGVESQSVQLVFAGQTVEHLWADELLGFLSEAARVLRPGGRLLLDSPNEEVTSTLEWSHPEHTIELRPHEIRALLGYAGFEVTHEVGHWLCRTPQGQFLPLQATPETQEWPAERRVAEGRARPSDCFSWWIEARRSSHPPNFAALLREIRAIWSRTYSKHILRKMQTQAAITALRDDGKRWATVAAGWSGALVFGPRCPLPPGETIVGFTLEPYQSDVSPGHIEVFQWDDAGGRVLASIPLPISLGGDGKVYLPLYTESMVFGVEFRLWVNAALKMSAWIGVDLYLSRTRQTQNLV